MVPVLIAVMVVTLFASGASVDAEDSLGESPFGPPGLPEFQTRAELAPGLGYTRVVRGETSEEDSYTVDVVLTENREHADEVAERLRDDGYEPRVEEVSDRPQDDPEYPRLYLARAGEFDTEAEAADLAGELEESGYGSSEEGGSEAYAALSAVYTGEDGSETTGPWVVSVVEAAPDFEGEIVSRLAASEIPGKERLTDISSRAGSLAGVNGGYFVVESADGTEG
ncbi:MAG: SPOR domain-containing protein, partial [Rubrobacteraceae bacterium]